MKSKILFVLALFVSTLTFATNTQDAGGGLFNIGDYFGSIEALLGGTLILVDVLKNTLKLGSKGTKILSWALPIAAPWAGYLLGIEGFLSEFAWWHVLLASGIAAAVSNKVAELKLLRGLFKLFTGKDLRASRPAKNA